MQHLHAIGHAIVVGLLLLLHCANAATEDALLGDSVPLFDWDDLERELQPLFVDFQKRASDEDVQPICEARTG